MTHKTQDEIYRQAAAVLDAFTASELSLINMPVEYLSAYGREQKEAAMAKREALADTLGLPKTAEAHNATPAAA